MIHDDERKQGVDAATDASTDALADRWVIAEAVRAALAAGAPVVALESTILAHGFPAGEGRVLADALEAAVRAAGAVPATIAIVAGKICVGLDGPQLDALLDGRPVGKCGARELAWVAARGGDGATTVSGTMAVAAKAGIAVFATGGIGGVHRGFIDGHDVSADIDALGRYPVLVVAAGVKSLLDLPRTLEALESRGVPVVGFCTDELPSFYARDSGLRLGLRVDSAAAAAAAFALQRTLVPGVGALLCNPPSVATALARVDVDGWVAAALADADAAHIRGAAITPFVLARLLERSGGRTLVANRALALANATLAAEVAVALASAGRRAP